MLKWTPSSALRHIRSAGLPEGTKCVQMHIKKKPFTSAKDSGGTTGNVFNMYKMRAARGAEYFTWRVLATKGWPAVGQRAVPEPAVPRYGAFREGYCGERAPACCLTTALSTTQREEKPLGCPCAPVWHVRVQGWAPSSLSVERAMPVLQILDRVSSLTDVVGHEQRKWMKFAAACRCVEEALLCSVPGLGVRPASPRVRTVNSNKGTLP